jgi:hypothetical protein
MDSWASSPRSGFSVGLAAVIYVMTPVAADAQETTTYEYDALGRLKKSSKSGGAHNGVQTTSTYDNAGNRTNLTTGTGGSTPTPPPPPPPTTLALTDNFLGILPAHDNLYSCEIVDIWELSIYYETCWLDANGVTVYKSDGQNGGPPLDNGYTRPGGAGPLYVTSARYGQGDAP